jgi:vacuolar iron transporter family protein
MTLASELKCSHATLASGVRLALGARVNYRDAVAANDCSGTKADRDDHEHVLEIEGRHIAPVPEGEREEIRQLFAAREFAGGDSERLVGVIWRDPLLRARTIAVEPDRLPPNHLALGGLSACVPGTGAIFFCAGAIKSRWSPVSWWCSGTDTLVIGMSAAAVAFMIGCGLPVFLQISAASRLSHVLQPEASWSRT